ncbi:MAG: hypothetical protein HXX09_10225 [Bacteroidetes bacterium]|nr:hypothetical protein [Bacteroidota bacterium]
MKKTEIILLSATFGCWVLGYLKVPVFPFFFLIHSIILLFFYFIFTFALLNNLSFKDLFIARSYSKIGSLKTIGTIGLGFALSSVVAGIMFIELVWYGGYPNVVIGMITLLIIGIVALIKISKSENKLFYKNVLFRAFGFIILGLISLFNSIYSNL